MARKTLTPWAELVPDTRLMTVKKLLALSRFSYPAADLFQ